MKANKTFAAWVLFVAIMLALQLTAVAQSNDEYDPPGRVARMNYVQGSVSFQPGGEGDWVSAVPNRPLTSGDNLWTDRGSRAELPADCDGNRRRSPLLRDTPHRHTARLAPSRC